MNISLKNFYQSFRSFINVQGKYLLFTALFYSLWLVHACVINQNFELQSFGGRMIGIATLQDYDVAARVSLFYKSMAVLLGSFVFLNLFGFLLLKKISLSLLSTELKIINYSSLAGLIFLFFRVFDYEQSNSLEFVYFIHKLMFGAILLKAIFFKETRLNVYNYSIIILIATSLYFFVADIYNLCGQAKNPDYLIISFIFCCLLVISALFIQKNSVDVAKQKQLDVLAYTFLPFTFLPFLSILKDELFLVLTKRGISIFQSEFPFYLLFILILGAVIWRRYKKTLTTSPPNQKKLLANYYLPLSIFSLISYVNYNHLIYYSDEVFEAGNKYLAIMEFKLFGVIPTLEKFNSHLLSDYFFSAIYTLFNGLQGREMELYDFLYLSFSCTLFYYFVFYITRNVFVAAFSILLFPYFTSMLPEPYSLCMLSVFALQKITNGRQSVKKYTFFYFIIAFLILWRIDLGYTCMVAMIVIVLYYHFTHANFKINWNTLLRSLIVFVGSIIILFTLLSLYRHTNLFQKLLHTLNYFTSAQTYGYVTLGGSGHLSYKMHYFVFPVLVGLILIALVVKQKPLTLTKMQRTAFLSLFFACLFYLINFNRGLIRHSLIEGMDYFTSSLVYFILPGSIFVFFPKTSQVIKFGSFMGISTLILMHYKLPDPKGSLSYFERLMHKIDVSENKDLKRIKKRVVGKEPGTQRNDSLFAVFINKNTNEKETFIDFSNSPMLYFYSQKITPSFFYQNPICSHNDYLQNVFLSDLNAYDCPYMVFSRNDDISRDFMDDVPNTLRHYRIAEYLFQHYQPYIISDALGIWKRNDVKNKNTSHKLYTFSQKDTGTVRDSLIKVSFRTDPSKKHLMKIVFKRNTGFTHPLVSFKNVPLAYFLESISDTVRYAVLEPKGKTCALSFNTKNICLLEINESEHLPNFLSEKPTAYNFMKLPYVWGKLDRKVKEETVLFEKSINTNVLSFEPYELSIPDNLDKTSGNTILVYCKNENFETQKLTLYISNKKSNSRSSVTFDLLGSQKEEIYAIRISSVYKWYSDAIDNIQIVSDRDNGIHVSKIQITKGS